MLCHCSVFKSLKRGRCLCNWQRWWCVDASKNPCLKLLDGAGRLNKKGVIEKQLIRVVTPEWAGMRFHIKKRFILKYGANPSSFNPPPHPQTLPTQNAFHSCRGKIKTINHKVLRISGNWQMGSSVILQGFLASESQNYLGTSLSCKLIIINRKRKLWV